MLRHHPKHKKLLVPGIISLCLLPLLFLATLSNHAKLQKQHALQVSFASNEMILGNIAWFRLPSRNYTPLRLDGNDAENKHKLAVAQLLVRNMIAKQDTINAIHLEFNPGSKYEDFVAAIDICHIEGLKTFVPWNNDLWLMYVPIKPRKAVVEENSQRTWICGGVRSFPDCTEQLQHEEKNKTAARENAREVFSPVIIMLFVLGFYSLGRVINMNPKLK